MKRTFIAVKAEAGSRLKDTISDMRKKLKDESIKWVDSNNMHITLAFLGDTTEESVEVVSEMIRSCCSGSGEFYFSLKGLGVFRNMNDARVIWAGIEHKEKLVSLFEIIKTGLERAGLRTEERSFSPHLTIGRIKRISNKQILESLIASHKETVFQDVFVRDVIFYESILGHDGPRYIPLVSVRL